MNVSFWKKKMEAYELFLVMLAVLSTAKAQTVVNPYSNPPSGHTFSYDLNQPGPTITCIGYTNFTGNPIQQNTVWTLNSVGIVSSSTFALSKENSSVGGFGQTNLTILNVTNNLDGSTIACAIGNLQSQQIAIFTVKIYRVPVLKMVGVVSGLKGSSVTFQIGDTSSPPPYPAPTFTITGNGTLSVAQLQYSHPSLTLSGLTETNSGSYVLTAENFRTNGLLLGASNGTFTLNVQFLSVMAAGISQTAAVQGQPFPVSLQCGTNLMGNPAPTVQWRTNNGTVVTSGGRYSIDNGPSNVLLNISNIDWTINGTWTCMLSNGILAPILVNISLFVLVPPSQPLNVTNGLVPLTNTKSQLSVSWQPPLLSGVPSLSLYTVVAVSARDPTNHTTNAAQTDVTIYGLLAGLPYNITIYAISSIGATNAVSKSSDTLVLSTDPDVPTVVCSPLAAGPGNVNVSWIIGYDGGRPVTAIQIAYNQVGGNYQAIQTVASPSMTSAIITDQFGASLTYAFMVLASNVIGNSTLSICGQVTITEGIPPAPKSATISAYGPTWVLLTISITASGAGATGSFMIRVVSTDTNLYVNQSFPFSNIFGAQLPVNVTNLREGAQYFFSVYASNVYGTSDPVTVRVNQGTTPSLPSTSTSPSAQNSSAAGAIAGGVLGAIIGVLLILIAIVVIYFIVRRRGASYNIDNEKKGVKVEEVDVDLGEAEKPELHYAELGSFNTKPAAAKSAEVQPNKIDEEPVTYSTVQISHAPPPPAQEKMDAVANKTDTSTTMV